jgi:hypothetical protein
MISSTGKRLSACRESVMTSATSSWVPLDGAD